MKKGDKFITNKGVNMIFKKYDKDGDALFSSPDVDFDIPNVEKGYMPFPVHVISMYMKKIED